MNLLTIPSKRATAHLLALSLAAAPALFLTPQGSVRAASAQSDDDIEQAKEQFAAGQSAYQEERFEEAAEAFLKAYELSERAELLYNIGKSYQNIEELKKAEHYFQEYINALPEAANAEEVVEAIITIQQKIADQMAHVEVRTSPAGAEVVAEYLDDTRCQAPCTLMLMPGTHTIHARLKSGQAEQQEVTVEAEEELSISFEFPGELLVRTDQRSGTAALANGESFSLPMRQPAAVAPGTHAITLTSAGGKTWTGNIDVESGELTSLMIPMQTVDDTEPTSGMSTLGTVSVALIGLAAGLAGGGAYMGMQAADTHKTLEKRQTALGAVDQAMVEQGQNQQTGANILFIASAASALTGAGLLTWDLLKDAPADEEIPASQPTPDNSGEDDQLLDVDVN